MVYSVGCGIGIEKEVTDVLEYFKDHKEIMIDTETSGRSCHESEIISLQIGDSDNQFFIDCRKVNILVFKDLLESKVCILQNAAFDYKFLKKAGIILDKIYDTMLAECVLWAGYEKYGYSLKDLCKRYLDIDMSKEERTGFERVGKKPFTLEQIVYGCRDVEYLSTIKKIQERRIKELGLEYCLNLENECVKALGDIEYNGMYLDQVQWREVARINEIKLLELEDRLDNIVVQEPKLDRLVPSHVQGDMFSSYVRSVGINYASPIQVKEICTLLGYPVDSTNEREIKKLVKKHKFFENLLEYREVSKMLSTYGDSFLDNINTVTGRIHTSLWQIKDTGRLGSSNPNMQNLPANNVFRNCFKARPGYKWVSIDYSGQELRLMADASGEEGFIDVLNRGEDLHCYVGSMMMGKTITKEDKEVRNQAKTINFMKPYGGGPNKLADLLGSSLEDAERLFKLYETKFPKLNSWLEQQGKFALKNGYSLTFKPCNRRRWYPTLKNALELRKRAKKGDKETWRNIMILEGQIERNGMNSPIQGSASDICKEALIETRKLVMGYNEQYGEEVAFMICTVHDAIDFEVREDLAKEFAGKAGKIMTDVGNKYVSKVNMAVDVNISSQWEK